MTPIRTNETAGGGAEVVRLHGATPRMRALARETFGAMAEAFEEPNEALSDAYVDALLTRTDFWAFAARVDGAVVGGITAHTIPITRKESRELFIYDLAVVQSHRRRGIGRQLMEAVTSAAASAGIRVAFVPAENEDTHALEFYRAVGGVPSEVTFFTFGDD